MAMKLIDEQGHKYGHLTVIELAKDKNGRTAWKCKCDCGNEKMVRGSDLRKGKITSCGRKCSKKEHDYIDLTGQRFGRLLVIERYPENNKFNKVQWRCKCDCGNEVIKTTNALKDSGTESCGCLLKEITSKRMRKDLIGQVFGYLTVIENTNKISSRGNQIWLCQCQCGNFKEVETHDLTTGNTQTCGCKSSSHGEILIANILNKYSDISYRKEATLSDLQSDKNRPLRFDFEIQYKNIKGYIEFNGRQHYESIAYMGGKEGFERRQFLDNLKISYCINNDLPLLIIKYDESLIEIEQKIKNFIILLGSKNQEV